jgi:hypothetical protein
MAQGDPGGQHQTGMTCAFHNVPFSESREFG